MRYVFSFVYFVILCAVVFGHFLKIGWCNISIYKTLIKYRRLPMARSKRNLFAKDMIERAIGYSTTYHPCNLDNIGIYCEKNKFTEKNKQLQETYFEHIRNLDIEHRRRFNEVFHGRKIKDYGWGTILLLIMCIGVLHFIIVGGYRENVLQPIGLLKEYADFKNLKFIKFLLRRLES